MGVLKLIITSRRDTKTLKSTFQTAGGARAIGNRIACFIEGLISGTESAQGVGQPPSILIKIQGNQTQATGTLTFSAVSTANDTFLINGVTFTAVASGATGNQWNVSTTATLQAAAFAAGVNGSVSGLVAGQVIATSVLGVVTIASAYYGIEGNQTTIAKGTDTGSVMTVSGARLTGGANDATQQTLNF
jgi:hypothetical protein